MKNTFTKKILTKNGQTVLEYTIITIILLGALLTIGNYFKKALQGRWKATVDGLGDQYDPRTGNSYVLHSMLTNTETTMVALNTASGGWWTSRTDETSMKETRQGYMSSGDY